MFNVTNISFNAIRENKFLTKISRFTVCDSNRKSMLARQVVQTLERYYLAVMLLGCVIVKMQQKFKSEHTHQKISLRPKCRKLS